MTLPYSYQDLKTLMMRLRAPKDGCPWDKKQTYQSIIPHTVEEVYEVIDAIDRKDYQNLQEELGDLLFQVVFYCQIATEEGRFNLDDVIDGLVSKLLFRHPHVFPDGTLNSRQTQKISEDDISLQWDQLKNQEKTGEKTSSDNRVLTNIPRTLPSYVRAKKLQSKAPKVGFDWPDINPVLSKVEEEFDELKEAIVSQDKEHIEAELGDLLFVLVNVARHTGVDFDRAIRRTNEKFESRFRFVEQQVEQGLKSWSQYTLEELDLYWNQAKKR